VKTWEQLQKIRVLYDIEETTKGAYKNLYTPHRKLEGRGEDGPFLLINDLIGLFEMEKKRTGEMTEREYAHGREGLSQTDTSYFAGRGGRKRYGGSKPEVGKKIKRMRRQRPKIKNQERLLKRKRVDRGT